MRAALLVSKQRWLVRSVAGNREETEEHGGSRSGLEAVSLPAPCSHTWTGSHPRTGRRGGRESNPTTHHSYVTPTPGALSRCTFLSDPESSSSPHSGGFFGDSLVPQGTRLPCAALVLRGHLGSR